MSFINFVFDIVFGNLIKLLLVPFIVLGLSFIIAFIVCLIKGFRPRKRTGKPFRKRGIFLRLFADFPYQFWKDTFNRDPDGFNEYGLHLFCGEQGSGKTTAVVELLQRMKQKYRMVKIRTNFNYTAQDASIENWRELVKNENGIYGQIEVIDEIQTWFNSMQSKDFPPEMLTEISQQRKQRKMLVGTAQIFGRVAKPIREQVTKVYCPMTIMGCLTVVRVSKPIYYDDENFRFKRFTDIYFFVHNDKIRNAFDTYKKIEGMSKQGFVQRLDLRTEK